MTDNEFYSILNRCMPDYNVVENIGSGNYGSVYKCERDGIYYAIKIISVPANEKELQSLLARSDKEAVQAYLKDKVEGYRKEIMLMAELKGNRSIVNIEDYKVLESESGLWYIVIRMELLTSLTLYASKYELDEEEVIRLGIDICDALSICEKHNIIHRDIKPENIMRHVEGTFKLGDFGVAKQLSKTTAGTIAGTEGFMAPEVYKGQEYNQTADIYSLGIVLYYYLNNKKMPHVAPNDKSLIAEQQAIEKRMTDKAPLPLPPKASKNLGQIVVKACMFDKSCRYRSAADMRADLVKALNGETVVVDLAPSSERGTIAQLNDKKTIAQTNDKKGNGGVDTPFTGDIVDNTSEERAKSRNRSTEAFDEHNKPKKKKKGLIAAVAAVCVVALGIGGFTVYQKFFAGPEPGIYLDENGNEYEVLSKEAMEEAYNLGVQYAEQGEYQDAIDEFNKVSEYSGKYEEAQKAIEKAKTDYQTALIEKATEYTTNKDYEKAFSMIDTGVAALGDNAKFKEAKDEVLAALKVDYVARAEEQEKSENYDKALECINLVLTYLPDDYEVKGMQSRVNAANVAKKALEKAADYKYKSEYSKLFSSLDKALDDVTDSTSATATIKMAYDSYMDEYLDLIETQTSDLETVSDYETAIKLLESAVEIFPNDYDLKTQLQEAQDMKIAVKAISDAEGYSNKSDYENLFKALNKALDTLSVGSDAGKKVQTVYDRYEKSYIEYLTDHIGEPETVSEYNNAITLLETAVVILPDNYTLKNQLELYQENKPIALFAQSAVSAQKKRQNGYYENSITTDSNVFSTNLNYTIKDNFNNSYTNASFIAVGGGYYDGNSSQDTYVKYDCEGYSSLTGIAALSEESKSYVGHCLFRITGETSNGATVVLFENSFNNGTRPQKINLDISDYVLLTVRLYSHKANNIDKYENYDNMIKIILSDFTLVK